MEFQILKDEALGYGLGVFETMRVESGNIIWLRQHLERMKSSARQIGIEGLERLEQLDIESEVKGAVCKWGDSFVLKLLLTNNQIYISFRENCYGMQDYEQGFRIATSKVRRDETSIWTFIKSFHYGDNILEKRRALEAGFQEALFLNSKGEIAECTMSNIFWVEKGQIYTPAVSCGILPGTMRAYVLEQTKAVEVRASYEQLIKADEVFLTNAVMEIMGVSQIDQREYLSFDTANQIRQQLQRSKDL